jgi:helicase MOV-10
MALSDVLPKKGFPIVFHGVRGNEDHTKSSPAYFNVLEASIIRNYCVKLTRDPERKLGQKRHLFSFTTFSLNFS